jgi:tripartite-type tricarboxylate transporter receptor subunit TctC
VPTVSTAQRSALTPEVPTMAEAGVPGYTFSISVGYLAPAANTPACQPRKCAGVHSAVSWERIPC